MKHSVVARLLGVAALALVAVPAAAKELRVDAILDAQRSGRSVADIVSMVEDPGNSISLQAGDIATLREAGVEERVLGAIRARTPTAFPAPVRPDDSRLVDLVRLIRSGISEPIIVEQVRQSGQTYDLSVNDLLYLEQNDARESTIAALMATNAGPSAAVLTTPLVFDDLVLVRGLLHRNRVGRLVLRGDTLAWLDHRDSDSNFELQIAGLEKVWFTCDARASADFCFQINLAIVRGDSYRFRDGRSASGSNATVVAVMEALRKYHPRLVFAASEQD